MPFTCEKNQAFKMSIDLQLLLGCKLGTAPGLLLLDGGTIQLFTHVSFAFHNHMCVLGVILGSRLLAASILCKSNSKSTLEHRAGHLIVSECSVMVGAGRDLKRVWSLAMVMMYRQAGGLHGSSTLEMLEKHCGVRGVLFPPLPYKTLGSKEIFA